MTETLTTGTRSTFGWAGMALGAVAFMLMLMTFWAGPFAPQPVPVADPSITERLTDAARGILNGGNEDAAPAPAQPLPPARDIDDWLSIGAVGLAGAAVVLGMVGFARGERRRPAFSAVTLGGGAILFQLVTGFILILVCLMLVGSLSRGGDSLGEIFTGILEAIGGFFAAIGEFFSNLFGGLFGG